MPGETLLWSGRPRQGLFLRHSDAFLIPFSLLWGGFAIFWEYSVYRSGAPFFFMIFGGFFVLVGLYMMFGRFIVDALVRRKSYYGITKDRVLIVRQFPTSTTKSLGLSTLSDITKTTNRNRSGSIMFGPADPNVRWFPGFHWPGSNAQQMPQFDYIKDVDSVYETLLRAKKNQEQASRN